jgi:hypothetical protein
MDRKPGEDCGYEWCATDHSDEGRYSVLIGHHTEDCLIFLASGNCTCGHKEAAWEKINAR